MNTLYARLDLDDVGAELQRLLLAADPDTASAYQARLQEALEWLKSRLIADVGAVILFIGCDDILFSVTPQDGLIQKLETLASEFASRTGCTMSCGVGTTIPGALRCLDHAKTSGKARIVTDTLPI